MAAKDEEMKRKDEQLADAQAQLEKKDEEIQDLKDTHVRELDELSNTLLAAEIERDLLRESEANLQEQVKNLDTKLAACNATLEETTIALIKKTQDLKHVKADVERREAELTVQLEHEIDAHKATAEELKVARALVTTLTQERDTTQVELKDVRQQLRNARRSSTYDETSFEIAREENRSLEAKLETVNNNYRMLETSKRSIERAFAEKINYCETLEKENTILKRTKIEGGMQTPAKCAVFVREDVSGYPSTSSTPIFDTDSVMIHSTPLRDSTNTNANSNNSINSLFRTPSLLRVVMGRNYNNTQTDTPPVTPA